MEFSITVGQWCYRYLPAYGWAIAINSEVHCIWLGIQRLFCYVLGTTVGQWCYRNLPAYGWAIAIVLR
jgi:hypothetical protein